MVLRMCENGEAALDYMGFTQPEQVALTQDSLAPASISVITYDKSYGVSTSITNPLWFAGRGDLAPFATLHAVIAPEIGTKWMHVPGPQVTRMDPRYL
jgi:hypothetical protein